MRRVFNNTAQAESFFTELGFVKDDGKWYLSADTARTSYFTFDIVPLTGFFQYHGSNGTDYTIVNFTGSGDPFLIVEYFALKNGGYTFRLTFNIDSTYTTIASLNYAIVAKTDGSGFVNFFISSNLYYDRGDGTITRPSQWSVSQLGDTSALAILVKPYDNYDSFIEARVKTAIAVQNVAPIQLYTFTCAGANYICGMFTGTTSAIKCGQYVFEID